MVCGLTDFFSWGGRGKDGRRVCCVFYGEWYLLQLLAGRSSPLFFFSLFFFFPSFLRNVGNIVKNDRPRIQTTEKKKRKALDVRAQALSRGKGGRYDLS